VTSATRADRRLLALAAVFAPARATALLSRLAGAEAEPLLREGERATAAPRPERLRALAMALGNPGSSQLPAATFEAVVIAERPQVAAALRRLAAGAAPSGSAGAPRPALARLLRERLEPLDG